MKIIKVVCDFCEKEIEYTIPTGGMYPEPMKRIGYGEGCDRCVDFATGLLVKHLNEEKKLKL